MINTSRICVIDFETTGFKKNAPVSLAVAFYEHGRRTYAKYILINPEADIEEGAYKVHGISQDEAERHYPFYIVWEEIKPYFENSLIVAHNSKYDVDRVLIPTLRRYGIPVPTLEKLCTRDNAKAILPDLKSYTLDALCDYFGIKCENHHTASFDTMMCQRIFARLYNLDKEKMFSVVIPGDYDPKDELKNEEEEDFDF
jgi:DNA polymerase-3 subunit epsilon